MVYRHGTKTGSTYHILPYPGIDTGLTTWFNQWDNGISRWQTTHESRKELIKTWKTVGSAGDKSVKNHIQSTIFQAAMSRTK